MAFEEHWATALLAARRGPWQASNQLTDLALSGREDLPSLLDLLFELGYLGG